MDAPLPRPLSIYLVASEQSCDALGAALIGALKAHYNGPLEIAGVGGEAMAAAGLASPFKIEDLSIFGINAIPKRLPIILRRIRETADAIVERSSMEGAKVFLTSGGGDAIDTAAKFARLYWQVLGQPNAMLSLAQDAGQSRRAHLKRLPTRVLAVKFQQVKGLAMAEQLKGS